MLNFTVVDRILTALTISPAMSVFEETKLGMKLPLWPAIYDMNHTYWDIQIMYTAHTEVIW